MRPAPLLLGPALLVLPALLRADVDFEKEILPFLEQKCHQCHKAPYEEDGKTVKPKAGLRLDAAWAIQAGGDDGAVVVAGKPGESPIYERVTLSPEDDDFMPPKDKADPLTPGETALLKRWIEEGAKFGAWAGNLEGKPGEAVAAPKPAPVSEIQQLYLRLSEGLAPLEEKAWESVTASGGRVMRLSQNSPLLSVDFRLAAGEAGDEAVLSAKAVASHVAHLDLSRSAATDAALAVATETPRLVRLDLSNTAIGDAGLASLKGLKELRYLNLHSTQVGDAGLEHLKSLKTLEAVYLWQSKATEAGVRKLRAALPDAKIHFK